MGSKLEKFLILCGFVGPVFFALSLLVLGFLFPGYNHVRDHISEFGAVDSPVKNIANFLVFFPLGVFMLGFGVGLFRTIGKDWSGKLGGLLLVISGIFLSIVPFFPCDPACNNFSQAGKWHVFFSDYSLYIAGSALPFLAYHSWKGISFSRRWAYIFFTVFIITGILTYFYQTQDESLYVGFIQRLMIFTPFVLSAVSALYLYRKIPDELI